MAIAKLKLIRMEKRANQAKSTMQQPTKSQILRKSKVRQPKLRLKPLKQRQQQQQQPMHRSQLMRNALKPILHTLPKGKSKLAKSRVGVAKSRQAKAAAAAAAAASSSLAKKLAKKQSKQAKQPKSLPKKLCSAPRKLIPPSPPMCAAVGLGVGAFYERGMQAGGVPRRSSPQNLLPQNLLPLMGNGIQKQAYRSFGINGPTPLNPNPRNAEMEVPLSTRLPIIDFISTDEFEQLLSAKKKFNKRL